MFIGIFAIFTAVLLSVVSAYYSLSGLMAIFSGAAISAAVMGGVLETAKISATVWLYNFWKKANTLMKAYFLVAIVILVAISSVGIYGFLAKSYEGQSATTSQAENRIERVEQRIEREEKDIARAQEQLDLLDESIERYLELDVVSRGLDAREEQAEERAQLRETINSSEEQIAEYEDELLELRQERDNLEVEVGPIKHIAAALYGQENAVEHYDQAARILIILLVLVFDPMAVLLMVSGNIAINNRMRKTPAPKKSPPKPAKPKEPVQEQKETTTPEDTPEEPPKSEPLKEKAKEEPPSPKEEKPPAEPKEESPTKAEDDAPPPKLHKRARPIHKRRQN